MNASLRRATCFFAVLAWASIAAAQTSTSAPAPTEDSLSAETLRQSALGLYNSPGRSATRVARVLAIARMAERLSPDDAATQQLLAEIYGKLGRYVASAQELGKILTANPDDYAVGMRWLSMSIQARDNAQSRQDLINVVLLDKKLDKAVRAEAAARAADLLNGQGNRAKALEACQVSLEFDPYNTTALEISLDLYQSGPTGDNPEVYKVQTKLKELQGNPMNAKVAYELADTLAASGASQQALEFYRYAWTVTKLRRQDEVARDVQAFLRLYLNAAMDSALVGPLPLPAPRAAGATLPASEPSSAPAAALTIAQVIETFEPTVQKYFGKDLRAIDIDVQRALIEAYQAAGQIDKARDLIDAMKASYDAKLKAAAEGGDVANARLTPELAGELAWFYLVTSPDSKQALDYARKAYQLNKNEPLYQSILGAAELLSGTESKDQALIDSGVKWLRSVMLKDEFAMAFLAEHYNRAKNKEAVAEMRDSLDAASSLPRSGPAFRRLVAALRKADVAMPTVRNGREIQGALAGFDRGYIEMATDPSKVLSVTLKMTNPAPVVGEPIELEATLTNNGKLPVPMGEMGLVSPVLGVKVMVPKEAARGTEPFETFRDFPLATWSAPRYLQPGQSLTTRLRLDIGALNDYLACRPLEAFEKDKAITVEPMLDQVQKGTQFYSSLPNLKIESIKFSRPSLLTIVKDADLSTDAGMAKAYEMMLGLITQRDLLRGELPAKMRAARQIGSLVAYGRLVGLQRATLPKALNDKFNKLLFLAMLQAALKDPSPAVRAQAIASIDLLPDLSADHKLEPIAMQLLTALVDDTSPVVRLRVLALMGSADQRGQYPAKDTLDNFAKDRDELVQALAKDLGGSTATQASQP